MTDFQTIMTTIQQISDKWNKVSISEKNLNSFTGMQKHLQLSRTFLQNEWKDVEAELKKISDTKIYDPSYISKRRKEIEDRYQQTREAVVSGIQKDIQNMVANKFKRLDKMLAEIPTQEQLALLQTIQMRGRNISKGELMKLMPHFFGNYQAMMILETVAEAAGHKIHTPMSGNVMDLYGELDRGGEYLKRAALEIVKPGKPDMAMRAFFYSDTNADPMYQRFIDTFDVPTQLQDYTISTALSEAEQAQVNAYFRQLDGLDPTNWADNLSILRITQQVMKAHPDDIPMMKRSQYSRYVREVEEIDKINAAKAEAMSDDQKEASA